MPRGRRSRLRARRKRQRERVPSQAVRDEIATGAVAEEFASSSSPRSTSTPQSSAAAVSHTRPTTTSVGAVSHPRANEGASYQRGPTYEQIQLAIERIHKRNIEKKVITLISYLLYKYQMKEFVTKAEIIKNVIQVYKKKFPEIFSRASEHLELVFGLDVKEMDHIRHIYMLVNKLGLSYGDRLSDDDDDDGDDDGDDIIGVPITGLLMTILGLIFINGNYASEELVWRMLNVLGLFSGRYHFIFGEPKQFITRRLVKQKYLVYQQVPNSDPPRYEFRWGPRAYAQTSKMRVLEFVAKMNHTTPSAFPSCYEEAVKDEEERIQGRVAARARIRAMAQARAKATGSSSFSPN